MPFTRTMRLSEGVTKLITAPAGVQLFRVWHRNINRTPVPAGQAPVAASLRPADYFGMGNG
jgi:hypothetical protein